MLSHQFSGAHLFIRDCYYHDTAGSADAGDTNYDSPAPVSCVIICSNLFSDNNNHLSAHDHDPGTTCCGCCIEKRDKWLYWLITWQQQVNWLSNTSWHGFKYNPSQFRHQTKFKIEFLKRFFEPRAKHYEVWERSVSRVGMMMMVWYHVRDAHHGSISPLHHHTPLTVTNVMESQVRLWYSDDHKSWDTSEWVYTVMTSIVWTFQFSTLAIAL